MKLLNELKVILSRQNLSSVSKTLNCFFLIVSLWNHLLFYKTTFMPTHSYVSYNYTYNTYTLIVWGGQLFKVVIKNIAVIICITPFSLWLSKNLGKFLSWVIKCFTIVGYINLNTWYIYYLNAHSSLMWQGLSF